MRRTATHVLSSPNPAQLEMRILANHGADARFAFLKGRWARAWRLAKAHAQLARAKAQEKAQGKVGLGGLAGYGGSDSESGGGKARLKPGPRLRTQQLNLTLSAFSFRQKILILLMWLRTRLKLRGALEQESGPRSGGSHRPPPHQGRKTPLRSNTLSQSIQHKYVLRT